MFGFERLEAWQFAVQLSDEVYRITSKFPDHERFGLTNQMRRSAVSIAANLAEGSGRGSRKEFVRFIQIAFGSLMETVSHVEISRRQHFLGDDDFKRLYEQSQRLARILSGLRNSLENGSKN